MRDEHGKMCIENECGELQRLTMTQLKEYLKPAEGKLNVDCVFILIDNSDNIALLFKNLKVP